MRSHHGGARWMMMLVKELFQLIYWTVKQPPELKYASLNIDGCGLFEYHRVFPNLTWWKEKAGKWEVPLPKVWPVAEDEMFKVVESGKRKTKQWKRMFTKATFVGPGFTRKPPKYERFTRPSGLWFNKAHVTHPELKCTFNLEIIGVKKNPNGQMYTSPGVLTKGSVIEVNVSELGLVTLAGKVVWGKYAQVTNDPENNGCVNAVLLV